MGEVRLNRRMLFRKLLRATAGVTVLQALDICYLSKDMGALAAETATPEITPFNLLPQLEYDYLSPMLKGIGEGVGTFSRSIGEAGGDIARGIGEGLGERLKDFFSNAEGKRKLYEYSQEQDYRRKRELIELMRSAMYETQAREIQLKLTEIQSDWDLANWNGILSRQETENLLKAQNNKLLILLSPPEISSDAPSSIRNNLTIELRGVEDFLARYYPERGSQHPVKFYSSYFKRPIGDINVEQLHEILTPISTAILFMEITDYLCTFHIGFWGMQSDQISFVSSEAWNWEQSKKELVDIGLSEVEALRRIRKSIVTGNKLFAAYLADLYYLSLDPYYSLQLPKLSMAFSQEGLSQKWLAPYLAQLQNIQQKAQEIYERNLEELASEVNRSRFTLENACDHPIQFALRFKNAQNEWEDAYWYKLAPNVKTRLINGSLADSDPPILIKDRNIFYYAETTDSSSFIWSSNDLTKRLGDKTVKMRKIELNPPEDNGFSLRLTCG